MTLVPELFVRRLNKPKGLPINVRDVSVTGDGQTDDYAALNEAVRSAGATGTLYFPAGTYVVGTNLTIPACCIFAFGAKLKPSSGVTVTLSGPVELAPGESVIATGTAGTVSITGVVESFDGVLNVKAFGAVGDGVTDDTAAIQNAITAAGASGEIVFPDGTYRCANLTGSASRQRFRGLGKVILMKNANGPILTHSGAGIQMYNMDFRGESASPSFTGDNLVISGDDAMLIGCGSRNAFARALKATGNKLSIFGSGEIWATTDASASGYDIEVGVSGTATLYHQLHGIVTTQNTGGLLFIDCGSQSVVGGQFGKYTVQSGTSPSGVNGGMLTGCRVLGPVVVEISSSTIVGNQFGASATITYGAGTSGHEYWGNTDSDAAIVNNGNTSAAIVRQVGNDGRIQLKFGADASNAVMIADQTGTGTFIFPQLQLPNNVSYRVMRASPNGTSRAGFFGALASDNVQIAADVGDMQIVAPSGKSVQFVVNSVVEALASASGFHIGASTSAPFLSSGTGTPEGAVTAPIGSLFMRTDGGASTTLYVKESGVSNTGWVAK